MMMIHSTPRLPAPHLKCATHATTKMQNCLDHHVNVDFCSAIRMVLLNRPPPFQVIRNVDNREVFAGSRLMSAVSSSGEDDGGTTWVKVRVFATRNIILATTLSFIKSRMHSRGTFADDSNLFQSCHPPIIVDLIQCTSGHLPCLAFNCTETKK